MNNNVVKLLVELRLLVGFLGEKSQCNWWGSNFISTSSDAFLVPVFSRTTMLARYYGVSEAAMLVHDEHIGVGANFHLYRMPDSAERATANALAITDFQKQLIEVLSSGEVAQTRLDELATTDTNRIEGPVVLGSYADADLKQSLSQSASHYSRAFKEGYKCFPYMREAE